MSSPSPNESKKKNNITLIYIYRYEEIVKQASKNGENLVGKEKTCGAESEE